MINIDEIREGDEVTLGARHGGLWTGTVIVDRRTQSFSVDVFGTLVAFAQATRTGHMRLFNGIKIHSHQAQLPAEGLL